MSRGDHPTTNHNFSGTNSRFQDTPSLLCSRISFSRIAQSFGLMSSATDSHSGRRVGDHECKVDQSINELLTSVLDELSKPDGRPTITLRRLSTHSIALNPETGALESSNITAVPCVYSWPGRTPQEAWRFGMPCCVSLFSS